MPALNQVLLSKYSRMRRSFLLYVALLLPFISMAASQGNSVQAIFSHAVFQMNGRKPYVETYIMVRGSSVNFRKTASGKYQGTIEVILTLSQGDQIKYADKYNLLSPETDDSTHISFNFIDQQRIPLSLGNYELGIRIRDLNGTGEPVEATEPLTISFPRDSIAVSDIQLVESYTKTEKPGSLSKGGFDLVPHINDVYVKDENKLIFYTEIYQSLAVLGEGQKYLCNFFLRDLKNNEVLTSYSGFTRYTASEVNVLMKEFNISGLPTGNYTLNIELRDKENALRAAKSIQFGRSNPGETVPLDQYASVNIGGSFALAYTNPDSLIEHIRCLYPISYEMEKNYANNVIKSRDLKLMQQYFLSFWLNRDALHPQEAWENYFLEVRKVVKEFSSSIRKGYNTDRGRVYLQYGPPDNRTVMPHEPSAYPYEIWQYYKVKGQSNRRFIFYNPDLVTNDYKLIHSDALGEIMNDQWQMLIYKRDTQTNDIDQTSPSGRFGSQIQQNYQTPR